MIRGLNLVRALFIALCLVIGWKLGGVIVGGFTGPGLANFVGLLAGGVIGGILIGAEISFTKRYLGVVAASLLGLLGGLILTVLFVKILFLIPIFDEAPKPTQVLIQVACIVLFSYLGLTLTLQSRENFKFVIPFVELQREDRTSSKILVDTNILIDGRIRDLYRTGLFDKDLVIPRFVINELQTLADSGNNMKRKRGRRGLEILEELRNDGRIPIEIVDVNIPYEEDVDDKLLQYAKTENLDLLSNDYNLDKVASVEGLNVLNLNDLADALKPKAIPGETMNIEIVKSGEEEGQGVGYLEDGTMVVVEDGDQHIGETIEVAVTSSIQTNAGQMIFSEPA